MDGFSTLALTPILPEIFMAVVGMLLLMIGAFRGQSSFTFVTGTTVVTLVAAMVMVAKADWSVTDTLNGMVMMDSFASIMKIAILAGLTVSLLLSHKWLQQNNVAVFEYPLLVLFSGIGMMLMTSVSNLLGLYVALELSSLCLYVLASIHRDRLDSTEAGLKYFILGALSSGLLLFGMSLIYGFSGSVSYAEIAAALLSKDASFVGIIVGMAFLLAGLCFKISTVPFHMWTPDVYQGAPTPVTALFAIVPKVAAFALIIRLMVLAFPSIQPHMAQIFVFVSVASMLWGGFAGLVQDNIKRLLAYSSIANMGYALLGLLGGQPEGIAAVVMYLCIYMATLAGVFAVLMGLQRSGKAIENIPDFAGLSKTSPFEAYALAALMFSMAGIPPMAGFFAKLFIIQSAVAAGYFVVAVVGVLASVVGAYYYIRIIKVMFFDNAENTVPMDKMPCQWLRVVSVASLAFVMLFTVWPNGLMAEAQLAAASLFQ